MRLLVKIAIPSPEMQMICSGCGSYVLLHQGCVRTASLELHLCSQASDGLLVLAHNVRLHSVFPRRDLLGQIDALGQLEFALLQWALEFKILDILAKISGHADDGDQTVFDLQVNLCTVLDVFLEIAGCDDVQGSTTVIWSVPCSDELVQSSYSRSRRVGVEVDADDIENVLCRILAVLEWVLAGYREVVVVDRDRVGAEQTSRDGRSQKGCRSHGSELHGWIVLLGGDPDKSAV